MNKFLLLIVFSAIWISVITAQDQHYWNIMGGTRSALMGGIVVGGVRDNSATFYNPGALGFINFRGHTISATAYHLDRLLIENGAGNGLDISSNQLNIIPTMAAGAFDIPILNIGPIIYTLITKVYSSVKSSARTETIADIIPTIKNGLHIGNNQFVDTFNGPEEYSAQYFLDVFVEEYWGGLSYAKKLNDNISIGFTGFGAYTGRTQNQSVTNFAYDPKTTQAANSRFLQYVDFWSLRFIGKFGVALDFSKIKAGLTVTAPSINLFGTANVNSEIASGKILIVKNPTTGENIPIDIVASDRQERLSVKFKSPMSIAAGVQFGASERLRFSFAAEWFLKQDRYTIINPGSNPYFQDIPELANDPTLDSQVLLKVEDESRSVLNCGAAAEYSLFSDIKTYLSFRTDYKSTTNFDTKGIHLGFSDWNIYHFTTGAVYSDESNRLGIGFKFSFGKNDNLSQIINITEPQIGAGQFLMLGRKERSKSKYLNFGVILSYTILLAD